ncbi:disulfide bond formation protein B [mine drainage metagenome]|uniref:Disulfide bond formation protein B n=1 Tax=mine drainage metagenome TaxID=410659 RepID=A0A1J5RG84_9ZZZZ
MPNRILAGRAGYLLGFVASFALVAFGLYIQVRNNLEPCPLCIFQRIAFMTTGVLFLLSAIHNPQGVMRRLHGVLQLLAAASGAGIAIRQIWIQNHADEVMAECGAGMSYLFEHFPLRKFLQLVFRGTGECSVVDWTWLGFSIPQLSLAAFAGLAGYAVLLAVVKKR